MKDLGEIMDLESKEDKNNDTNNNNEKKNTDLNEKLNEKYSDKVEEINTNILKEINDEEYKKDDFVVDDNEVEEKKNILGKKRKLVKRKNEDFITIVNYKDEEIKNTNNNNDNKNKRSRFFNIKTGIHKETTLLYKENNKFDEDNNKYIYEIYLLMNSFISCFLENLDVKDFPFSNLIYVIKKMENIKNVLKKYNYIYVNERYNIIYKKDNFFLYYLKMISKSNNDLNNKLLNYNNLNNNDIDEYIDIIEKTYHYCYEYDNHYKNYMLEKKNVKFYVDDLYKSINLNERAIKKENIKKEDENKERIYNIKENIIKNMYLSKKKFFIYDDLFDEYYKNYKLVISDKFELSVRALYEYIELTIRSYIDHNIGRINKELIDIIDIIKKKKNDYYLTFNWGYYFLIKDICKYKVYVKDVDEIIKKLTNKYSNKFCKKFVDNYFENNLKDLLDEKKN
jgi:hypothetical protein